MKFTAYRFSNDIIDTPIRRTYTCDASLIDSSDAVDFIIDRAKSLINSKCIIPAATLEAKDVSKAFELTNSIDDVWYENPIITIISNECMLSSSSVGDIFEANGQFIIVAPVGFITFTM